MRLTTLFAALIAIPSVALAAEPSKGTVITVASIGGWVIFSSVGIAMRRKRDARTKTAAETAPTDQPQA